MSIASEQRFYDYIYLKYKDDDSQPLDEDLGEVLWSQGRGSTEEGDVTYVRIDRVAELVRELRQYVINHEISIGECVAWQELKATVKDARGVLIFSNPATSGREGVRCGMDEEAEVIDVSGEGIYEHIVGDTSCSEGWCGGPYPLRCKCGGLIHADFGDEELDGYWIHEKCDRCGKDFEHEQR